MLWPATRLSVPATALHLSSKAGQAICRCPLRAGHSDVQMCPWWVNTPHCLYGLALL